MGTTLQNGVYLPNEGERNCYAGLKTNWEILDQKVADVTALQQAVAGALHREIVVSLPTTDIDPNTIYMILNGTSATENIYDEYMYISNAWELIGTSATDLTNYYTKAEVDGKLLLKANASDLTSHTGDTTIHVTASDKAKWNTVALIKQLRLVNTQVGSATTIAFANIDDTNGIKVGDKCMDLDGKMFEITAVDTANQTVTVGTALIDLALDSNVMHLSGDETAAGQKTLVNLLPLKGEFLGTEASNNGRTLLYFIANRDTQNQSGIYLTKFRQNKAQGAMSGNDIAYLSFDCLENSVRTNNCLRINFLNYVDDVPQRFILWSGITERLLGTAGVPWSDVSTDKINALNPGALSFPNLNNGLDISGYIAVPNTHNTYTPPVNGWVSVVLKSTSGALALFMYQGDISSANYSAMSLPNETEPCVMCCLPVVGNMAVSIDTKGSNAYVSSAKFYPCQGNV